MPPKKSTRGRKSTGRKKSPPKKRGSQKAPRKSIPKKSIPPRQIEVVEPSQPIPVLEPKKKRAQRKKPTLETHNQKFEDLLELINKEIERKSREKEKGTRTFQRIRKMVRELQNETPKVANAKRRVRNTNGNRVSGFMIKYPINAKGAEFLQVEKGTPFSRNEITNAICVYSHLKPGEKRPGMLKWEYLNPGGKRDLQKDGKKMVIEPDDVLKELLQYEDYQKRVKAGEVVKKTTTKGPNGIKKTVEEAQTDDALFYWVAQKLIGQLFDKPKKE